jgi:hypothetical protein
VLLPESEGEMRHIAETHGESNLGNGTCPAAEHISRTTQTQMSDKIVR